MCTNLKTLKNTKKFKTLQRIKVENIQDWECLLLFDLSPERSYLCIYTSHSEVKNIKLFLSFLWCTPNLVQS